MMQPINKIWSAGFSFPFGASIFFDQLPLLWELSFPRWHMVVINATAQWSYRILQTNAHYMFDICIRSVTVPSSPSLSVVKQNLLKFEAEMPE
jgi:type IV secretory pathway TraG/TraD family ATPase VirD4